MALYSVSNGAVSDAADIDQYYNLLTGATTDQQVTVSNRVRAQLAGATTASGYVGGFGGFAPSTGTFAAGDFGVSGTTGVMGVCTTGGSPGTWQQAPTCVQTVTLGSTTPSVTFSSIPAFSFLRLTWHARSDAAAGVVFLDGRVNGDTGTNYHYQFNQAYGAAGGLAGSATGQTGFFLAHLPAASATANYWGGGECVINGWSAGVGYLTATATSSCFVAGASSCYTEVYSNQYVQLTTYTSLTLFCNTGSFVTGSTFSLYGYP